MLECWRLNRAVSDFLRGRKYHWTEPYLLCVLLMYFCAGRTRSDKNFLKPDTFLAGSDKLSGEWNKIRTKSIMFRTKFLKHLCLKVKLLREFSVIFLGNSLLVLLAWKVYGERIRNKFMTARKVRKSLK